MKKNHLFFILLLSHISVSILCGQESEMDITSLKCEYLENPMGIDVLKPRLSWITESEQRGWMQSAYHILVASSKKKLKQDEGDLWDSGKVPSDQSINVVYNGKLLHSRTRCYWKVRVWDKENISSDWSSPAMWSMGLLKPEDWQGAQWIGLESDTTLKLGEYFLFELPEGRMHTIDRVVLHNFGGTDSSYQSKEFSVQISQTKDPKGFKKVYSGILKAKAGPQTFTLHPVTTRYVKLMIHSGYRRIHSGYRPDKLYPYDIMEIAEFEAYTPEGKNVVAAIMGAKILAFSSQHAKSGPGSASCINDGVLTGETGSWCSSEEHTKLPARYVRREFEVSKPIKSATAYVCGLGEFDFFINGKKVGDHERDPGRTEFNKRVLYVTFDVKEYLQNGANATGVILGNGRFFAPRRNVPIYTKTFGAPRLLLHMRINYEDGTTDDLNSSVQWQITDKGPIRENNEYDGETYDARMEMPGWNEPGFNETGWQHADLLSAPGGYLQAMVQEPMRVCETFTPIKVSSPVEDVHIVDFGQYFYGVNQITVNCPAGTIIKMVSAGSLLPNGRVNLANERNAQCTDIYVCKGGSQEVWRPRFRGHGHRYVEITGFPGIFTADNIKGLFIHNDVDVTGHFESSNTLLNTYNRIMTYDQLGQMRDYPSSEQDRDERQGWLGGSGTCIVNTATHLGVAPIYSRWLDDIRLDQRSDGAIPSISPSYWIRYKESVVWPADIVLIPLGIYKYYGDKRVLAVNYPAMKKWMSYTERFILSNGTIDANKYGDWCDVSSMDGGSRFGATNRPLISTAYFTYLYQQMAFIAKVLNEMAEAKTYSNKAENMKLAFNNRFFDSAVNKYTSGTQASYMLPLAFGLVPEANRNNVITNLIHDIEVIHNDHLTVGLVGLSYYMRTLSNIGHTDAAYRLTQQTTRPSWGYMVNNGATAMWERWDMNTQGPHMNGQGFMMLTGDLHAWMYQALAGINADHDQPGFKHVILKPQPVQNLNYVNCSFKSMHGWIVSNWKCNGNVFKWDVTVPANTKATIYLPAEDIGSVTEDGKPVGESGHIRFLRMENGRAVFEAGSGLYEFRSIIN